MKVLVTGASGFVGSYMVGHLLEQGHEVLATSDAARSSSATEVSQLDITDPEACIDFISAHRPDGIVNLAGQAGVPRSWDEPELTLRVNTVGTANLLMALRKVPDTRVVFVGSGQQYAPASKGDGHTEDDPLAPTTPYAVSKIAAEGLAWLYHERFGSQVICARPFNHTGPGQRGEFAVGAFCSQIVAIESGAKEKTMVVGNLSAERDFVDVRDVVRAYLLLLERGRPGQAYNVCSGRPVPVRSLLDILLSEAGLAGAVEIIEDPDPRPGDVPVLFGDPSKIRQDVGWEPVIPLRKSLAETLEWYRGTTIDGG